MNEIPQTLYQLILILDPDAPVFVTGPYGRGGLQPSDIYQRPFSALSGVKAPPSWRPRQSNDNSIQVNCFSILGRFLMEKNINQSS